MAVSTVPTPAGTTDWQRLADQALAGELISREDARAVLTASDDELLDQLAAAWRVRRAAWGNRVRLHFLVNAQSGLCPEDCGYCSQSTVSTAEIEKYPMLAKEKVLEAADRAARLKAGTLCLVISGRAPGETVFGKVLDTVREIRARHDLKVCACLGLLNDAQVERLKEAGVETINHNLNASQRFTEEIVSTHTFDDRVATVAAVKNAGVKTCSGGILGMGESDDDVIDLALSLREMDVKSVPVNFLIPVEGTPLEGVRQLTPRQCLRILTLYRFLLPTQEIRISGGREVHLRALQPLGLYPANSIFIGDYLTTQGQTAHDDFRMIEDAGFVLETPDGEPFTGDVWEGVPAEYPRAPLEQPRI
jgi:biotin synthase